MYSKRIIFILIFALLFLSVFYLSFFTDKQEKVGIESNLNEFLEGVDFDSRDDVFEWNFTEDSDGKILLNVISSNSDLLNDVNNFLSNNEVYFSSKLLPGEELNKQIGIVNQSVASARVSNSRASGMATQVLMGMKLRLLEKIGEWYRVKTPQNYIAWINEASLFVLDSTQIQAYDSTPKLIITSDNAYAYDLEFRDSRISDLVNGNVILFESEQGDIYNVILPGDRKAYINKKDAKFLNNWREDIVFDENKFVEFSLKFNGQPYLWGGNSFKGIDCSGYTGAVYLNFGLLLPRDADQQVTQGDDVIFDKEKGDFSKLKIGDLLFFGSSRITHTAIYIGNSFFIHSSGYVHMNSLDAKNELYNNDLMLRLKFIKRINKSNNLSMVKNLKNSIVDVF
jgi:gamma-D-glutamyl-L-lysine dipeptidyl-peptidase